MPSLPNRRRLTPSPGPSSATTPASPMALLGLCLWLVGWGLSIPPALAQFNGTSGIYALNHMTFGLSTATVANPGTGYSVNDTITVDCPDNTTSLTTKPTLTITSASAGAVTGVSVATPGFATSIPSTGLAGGANGICIFTQLSTSGTGTGATFLGTFGFSAASINGTNTFSNFLSSANTFTGFNAFTQPVFVSNSVPFGTYNTACGVIAYLNVSNAKCQANGFTAANQLYLTNDVGSVALFAANTGTAAYANPTVSSYTATTATLSSSLSAGQVSQINAWIASGTALGYAVPLLAKTSDGLLGNITAATTTSLTVTNWMAPNNSAAGQVPVGATVAINPQTHAWASDLTITLPSSAYTTNATGLEIDALNQKGVVSASANVNAFVANCQGSFNCNQGYSASGGTGALWTDGFVAQGVVNYGFYSAHSSLGDASIGFFCATAGDCFDVGNGTTTYFSVLGLNATSSLRGQVTFGDGSTWGQTGMQSTLPMLTPGISVSPISTGNITLGGVNYESQFLSTNALPAFRGVVFGGYRTAGGTMEGLLCAMSRASTSATFAAVAAGDTCAIRAWGDDGTSFNVTNGPAQINFKVTGTVTTGVVPGEIDFFTSTTGGALTQALALDNTQKATFAGAVAATLPTSAGGGGIYVCIDSGGNMYKKSSCP